MYENAAILASVVLLYSSVAARVERSWLSGAILFTAAGLVLGPTGFGVLSLTMTGADLRTLAELALAMVLFTDAARADLVVVRRAIGLPERLLLLGLPLTLILGFLVALMVFPSIDPLEAALLAALLAPTDAALGLPVVTDPRVPGPLREALNFESGLNDGICVPVVVILLDFAIGRSIQHGTLYHIISVAAEEIGIGLIAGFLLTRLAIAILRVSKRAGWTDEHWRGIPVIALAVLCFTAAQAAGGSGFIACFTGGLVFAFVGRDEKRTLLDGAARTGDILALLTWIVFGGPVLGRLLPQFTWQALLYAVLSLTVIRGLPVVLSLAGTALDMKQKLFVGWFGPRGLASVVFAIIIFDAGLPGKATIAVTAATTVLLSVIAHGLSAHPMVSAIEPDRRRHPRQGRG